MIGGRHLETTVEMDAPCINPTLSEAIAEAALFRSGA